MPSSQATIIHTLTVSRLGENNINLGRKKEKKEKNKK
jgi:hypothetical protein